MGQGHNRDLAEGQRADRPGDADGGMPGNLKAGAQGIGRRAFRAAVLAAALSAAGCSASLNDTPPATGTLAGEPVVKAEARRPPKRAAPKVALLLPLSAPGSTGAVAKGLKQAAELALIEHGGSPLDLVVKDDLGTPEGARKAAAEAVGEGAELILGPLLAKSVAAVVPAAAPARVPVIAFSNDRQTAGSGAYLMGFLAQQEIDRIVAFAIARGRHRLAALVSDDAYGRLAEQLFRAAVDRHNGTVAAVEIYPAGSNAMLDPVRHMAEAIIKSEEAGQPIDALFIPAGADVLAALGPILAYGQIDTRKVKLLGAGGWDLAGLGHDPTMVGAWYPAPEPHGWQSFSQRFSRTFGTAPPRIATIAYDAVTIAIALADRPDGQRYSAATLSRPAGFAGVDGVLRLAADGSAERALAVLEVQQFGAAIIDTARSDGVAPASVAATAAPQVSAASN